MSEPNFYIKPEEKTLEQINEEYERDEADRIFFREVKPKLEEKEDNKMARKNKITENYVKLYHAAREYGVNVENTFVDTGIKRKHLIEIMGYSELKSKERKGKGRQIPIEEANDARIGLAYRNCYNMARKLYNE